MAALAPPNPDRLRPPNPTGSSGRSVCGLKVVCQTVCQTVGLLATLDRPGFFPWTLLLPFGYSNCIASLYMVA